VIPQHAVGPPTSYVSTSTAKKSVPARSDVGRSTLSMEIFTGKLAGGSWQDTNSQYSTLKHVGHKDAGKKRRALIG
jgi:hypothetical protein